MKSSFIAILFSLYSYSAFALEPREGFNIELMEIYNSLVSDGNSQDLIGKEYTALLSLKFASEKHLIFSDTYIRTSDNESYQIVKWEFSPEAIKDMLGKSNVKFNITFKVLNARKNQPYKDMPHIIATVLQISPNKLFNKDKI
jgi:hypothetical protein